MLSQEDANACLDKASADLKKLSYHELEALAERQTRSDDEENIEMQVGDDTVYIGTTFAKFGHLRKRVSVEMVLSAEDRSLWQRTPCVYFERFESGRLYVARAKGWKIALFKALPYAFLGVVAIALVALVCHLFLRGG